MEWVECGVVREEEDTWALAASRQSSTHSLAEVWMTPPPRLLGERDRNWGGNPAGDLL